ncbi:O-antigen polymerase [Candidatus Moduliflexus flocculans]|uniref:O-antigen polymerase n=1 Tax=Candidatus Moduliflexus flocculans TaxID=1499966 RepID=A0A0S6VZW6_9BACT|nr:O-antigen polymerase [Candidatus Moduliflexus flocculans]
MFMTIIEKKQGACPTSTLPFYQRLRSFSIAGVCCFVPLSIAFTDICLGVLLATYVFEMMATRTIAFPFRAPFHRALLTYIIVTIALAPFAVNMRLGFTSLTNLADIGIFFLLSLAFQEKPQIKRAILILMVSITLCAGYGIIQHYLEVDLFRLNRPISFLKHLNDDLKAPVRIAGFSSYMTFAGQLGMALPVVAAQALCAANRRSRIRWLLAFFINGIALVWTYTRSAWLGALVALIVIGFLKKGKQVFIPVVFLFMIFAGLVFVQQHREKLREEQVERYRQNWTEETSSGAKNLPNEIVASTPPTSRFADRVASIFSTKENQERIYTWISSLKMFRDHLLTGIGHGNYSTVCQTYRIPYGDFPFTSRAHAHNNLLQAAVVGGLPLLICAVYLWSVLFRSLYRAYQENKRAETGMQAVALGVFGSAIAFFVQGMFEYNFGDSEVIVMLWLLVVCALHSRDSVLPKFS